MARCVRVAGLFCALFDYILRQHFDGGILWRYVCPVRVVCAAKAGEGVPLARPEFPAHNKILDM